MKKCLKYLAVAGCLASATTALAYYGNNKIDITEQSYSKEDFPESLAGLRIVHLSDLQLKSFGADNKRLLSKVKSLYPDFIVFTGDALDRRKDNHSVAIKLMGKLVEIAPVFFVDGNHELAFDNDILDKFHKAIEKLGVHIVRDEKLSIAIRDARIDIAGLDERHTMVVGKNRLKKREDVDIEELKLISRQLGSKESVKFVNQAPEEIVNKKADLFIFLAHEPQFLVEYAASGADFIFSGHAHGGQVRIPFIGGVFAPGQGFFPSMAEGVLLAEDSIMMVSRGLGNSSFPIRVFNCPEIILAVIE